MAPPYSSPLQQPVTIITRISYLFPYWFVSFCEKSAYTLPAFSTYARTAPCPVPAHP